MTNVCNTVGDSDVNEAVAITKSLLAYTRYSIAYCYACETTAIRKCIVADACNAIRDGNIRETTAT